MSQLICDTCGCRLSPEDYESFGGVCQECYMEESEGLIDMFSDDDEDE